MTPTPSQIRATLTRLGWTQRKLAEAMGVNERTVRFWLAGHRNMSATAARLFEIITGASK